jgi:hypothetical protein
MASPTQQQLLGCLIGALDDAERRRVEDAVACNPALQREMGRLAEQVGPLLAARRSVEPPPGLAARTCRRVALCAEILGVPIARAASPAKRGMSPAKTPPSGAARFAWPDLIVSTCIVACAALLVFPALHTGRVQSRLNNCRQNLHEFGAEMLQINDSHRNNGPVAAAAVDRTNVAARRFPADPSVYGRILQRQAAASVEPGFVVRVSGHVSPLAATPDRAMGSHILYPDGSAVFLPDVVGPAATVPGIECYSSPERFRRP